jgi:hypothetical protein
MVDWLFGIPSRQLSGNIFEIHITGYGPADVGPYAELVRHVGKASGLQCHHIVEEEHLELVPTRFTLRNAPAVAIPWEMHTSLVSPRFTAEQLYLGGRHGGKAPVTKQELLALYKNVYMWHTPFRELFSIAQLILR